MHNVTIYLAYNEDGDIAADMDRDAAIERLRDDFSGTLARVIAMNVTLPDIVDLTASLVVPADKAETVTATVLG